jgi:hypothetical protein
VQVDPIKPTLKLLGNVHLKLEYDDLLSGFAFNFNLRHYIKGCREAAAKAVEKEMEISGLRERLGHRERELQSVTADAADAIAANMSCEAAAAAAAEASAVAQTSEKEHRREVGSGVVQVETCVGSTW